MHYTLSYIEGNSNSDKKPDEQYLSIHDCINWADKNSIDYYLLQITEWDDGITDGYGIPEIVATVNLQAVVDDSEIESLSKYQAC